MKLSFIIPCYNGAETLRYSVDSVVRQGIDDYEIIIINDGSTDDTLKEAYRMQLENTNIVVLDKPNGGVSSARNLGIRNASGDYIVFLDADDEFDPFFWKEIKPYTLQSKSLIIFGFDSEVSPSKIRRYNNRIDQDLITDYLMGRVHIHMCSILTKKSVIIDNNILFNEGTYFSEDREFMVRVFLASYDYVYVDKNLFHYKFRENSAMHLVQYNYRKSTSIDAMERVLKLMVDNTDRYKAALIQLDVTILLHVKLYLQANCQDENLYEKLQKYCLRYLKCKTPLTNNRYSVYVWFFSWLYRVNERLFLMLVRLV